MNLFKKALYFTDLHFGRSGNSIICNKDNNDFLDWALDRGKTWGADTLIFGGDWHNNRNFLEVSTLVASLQGMEKIDSFFKNIYFLLGNHDILYREKRDVTSTEFARKFSNITIVRDPLTIGEVTFLPWLVGDEPKSIRGIKSRYVFGHLEFPNFKMNAAVVLPDAPHLIQPEQFLNQEFVFSGHFHIRQNSGKIVYTGNAMPFNFSDNWDENRGIMLLEWGKDPIFEAWADQPLFRTTKLSELLANPNNILSPKATVRATMDVAIHYEEAQEIRETLEQNYGVRKLEIVPNALDEVAEQDYKDERIEFKSVDQMVIDGIMSIESKTINPTKLVEIYRSLAVSE